MKSLYATNSLFFLPADNLNWFDNDRLKILDKLFSLPLTILAAFSNLLTTPLADESRKSLYVSREHEKTITIFSEGEKTRRKKQPPKINPARRNDKISLEKIRIFKNRKYIHYGD